MAAAFIKFAPPPDVRPSDRQDGQTGDDVGSVPQTDSVGAAVDYFRPSDPQDEQAGPSEQVPDIGGLAGPNQGDLSHLAPSLLDPTAHATGPDVDVHPGLAGEVDVSLGAPAEPEEPEPQPIDE